MLRRFLVPPFSPVRWPCQPRLMTGRAIRNGNRRVPRPAGPCRTRGARAGARGADRTKLMMRGAADPRFLQDLRNLIATHVARLPDLGRP